jgi:uncharacterized membrane protein
MQRGNIERMKKKIKIISVIALIAILVFPNTFNLAYATPEPPEPCVVDLLGRVVILHLIVGCNDNNSAKPLHFAENDATDLFNSIRRWQTNFVDRLLIGSNATKGNVKNWFEICRFLADTAWQNLSICIFFYFSGHGDENKLKLSGGANIFYNELADEFKLFRRGVSFAVILDSCFSYQFSQNVISFFPEHYIMFIGQTEKAPDGLWFSGWQRNSYTWNRLLNALEENPTTGFPYADLNRDGKVTIQELKEHTGTGPWGFQGDDDLDGKINEDDLEFIHSGDDIYFNYIDNDGDGAIDEDPAPKYVDVAITYEKSSVGGIILSVDKFMLLAPYICFALTTIVVVATTIYIKNFKRKNKSNNKKSSTVP